MDNMINGQNPQTTYIFLPTKYMQQLELPFPLKTPEEEAERTTYYYRNDIISNKEFIPNKMQFYDEETEQMYNNLHNRTNIDKRIAFAERENFLYFDLSNLGLTNAKFEELLRLSVIQNIMNKIEFLDLSHNTLTSYNYYNMFPNITCLDISYNAFSTPIFTETLHELTCTHNQIPSITSNSIILLRASNNLLETVVCPNAEMLCVDNNLITSLGDMPKIKHLDCNNNKIRDVNHLTSLEELFITDNLVEKFKNLNNVICMECSRNPIKRVGFLEKLQELTSSTNVISNRYRITSAVTAKELYIYNFDTTPVSLTQT